MSKDVTEVVEQALTKAAEEILPLRQRVKELEARCIQHAGEKEKLKAELAEAQEAGARSTIKFLECYAEKEKLERRVAGLEQSLGNLLKAAMPIRKDGATLQEIARGIPELYDACHSAYLDLNRSNHE